MGKLKSTVDLLDSKDGIFSLLDDEIILPDFPNDSRLSVTIHHQFQNSHKTLPESVIYFKDNSNESMSLMNQEFGHLRQDKGFIIRHFGGDMIVGYDSCGMSLKNKAFWETYADLVLRDYYLPKRNIPRMKQFYDLFETEKTSSKLREKISRTKAFSNSLTSKMKKDMNFLCSQMEKNVLLI